MRNLYFQILTHIDFDDDEFFDTLAIFAKEYSDDDLFVKYPIKSTAKYSDVLNLLDRFPTSFIFSD